MIDPTASASAAAAGGGVGAGLLVVAAGIVSGVGPCAGIRTTVLMSVISGQEKGRMLQVCSFVLGIGVAYAILALIAPLFTILLAQSSLMYVAMAGILLASGLRAILGRAHGCADACASPRSIGAAFVAGVGSSAILSPCCTPLILAILNVEAQNGDVRSAALLLGAFALGHAIPMVAISTALAMPLRRFCAWAQSDSAAIVSGALQIGVGAFYAVLA